MYLNGEDGLKQYRMFSRIKGSLKSFIYRECLVVYFFLFCFYFLHEKNPDAIPYKDLYIQ